MIDRLTIIEPITWNCREYVTNHETASRDPPRQLSTAHEAELNLPLLNSGHGL